MSEIIDIELDEKSDKKLRELCEAMHLPASGVIILALQSAIGEYTEDKAIKTISGEEFLNNVINKFESSPPENEEDLEYFLDKLRYAAQFMTTRQISNPYEHE